MSQTFVLITGGNRGLGLGLVRTFLSQPHHTVISANRNPEHATSKALFDLPKGEGSNLIVVKYDAGVEQAAYDAVTELKHKHGIDTLDIVIANAGMVTSYPLVKDVKRAELQQHIDVNAYAVVTLYQATRSLLQKSTKKPVFAIVGSGASSLGNQPPIPNAAYGPSKILLNWYGVRINAEDEWLNAFILDPGFSQTEMGNKAAEFFGMGEAPVKVEDSVGGMFKVITTANKETHGGKFVSYTGEILRF
ncbi:NAD(P)-binding protein [Trichoderma citrinoviride]|uniref:NAD(P)-binding protein n=1 Tax=Trichoderma citrinoviride TaxID=58853 RepID=A0A2T4AYR5_9HYPO|nr:NAD(P)-binding protein [Trichoderma citrinoviride]PTB62212.1 NAD(P)-binding protein [Trichoderma citrinoviride]